MTGNPDFKDLFSTLNTEGVEYLVVGAYAVTYYAEPRYTKDLDLFINPAPANAARVWRALAAFGTPLADVTEDDFTRRDMVYQIGVEPNRIDILMGIKEVTFPEAWTNSVCADYDGIPIRIIGKRELIKTKRATGRPQDLIDAERIEAAP